ncbi:MAG: PIN domain-containing protein [Candidatus Dormiibacterota bacterium]
MTRCYLDTNYAFSQMRDAGGAASEPYRHWRRVVLRELGHDSAVISARVFDELAYRLVLTWLREDGVRDPLHTYRANGIQVMRSMRERLGEVWHQIERLRWEVHATTHAVVDRALLLMGDPGLSPRDAFHAAHAIDAECPLIASSDGAFDLVPALHRIAPQE